MASKHSLYSNEKLDKKLKRVFQDEGIYPAAQGSYHMYHRIDGILVAVGVIDITKRNLSSCYFV
jgi:arginyl-tRNA--protein-N-Asp/Glu arginylyltransferase